MFPIGIYVAIGLAIGSLSGVMGIGGGVLLVPALIWICDFKPREAAGTTLAILIPPIGLPAAWRAYYDGLVNLEAALWIAGAFMVGAYGSRLIVDYIPDECFRFGFGLLMMFVALRFMIHSDSEATSAAAGVSATILAWLAYFGLKVLGQSHLTPPDLGQQIRDKHEQRQNVQDYQI
ncbi:MAG: sulfite exporter TauE/SafE family protein [Planctomycetes bacterium]|nr:sulfite exporter TauE/SafE family protein [Planctomycetota bacterium]